MGSKLGKEQDETLGSTLAELRPMLGTTLGSILRDLFCDSLGYNLCLKVGTPLDTELDEPMGSILGPELCESLVEKLGAVL